MAQLEDRGVAVLRADCYERSSLVRLYRHQRVIAYLYSVHTVVASTRLAKYQYQYSRHKYQYLDIKYQHQYQYPSLKCKYQYHYLKTILKYGSSTSRSTQYYNPECS